VLTVLTLVIKKTHYLLLALDKSTTLTKKLPKGSGFLRDGKAPLIEGVYPGTQDLLGLDGIPAPVAVLAQFHFQKLAGGDLQASGVPSVSSIVVLWCLQRRHTSLVVSAISHLHRK